ncbi:MAG TPA: 30S ribosomal protein S9 [Candidatus Acidoferrum sp.]|nr:30S ribosomal protein S9 [Candidatus Acidoferrum sp.]
MVKIVNSSGKRKTSIARAAIKEGQGFIKINKKPLDIIEPELVKTKVQESLAYAGNLVEKLDIKVDVHGGGIMSQADAARTAIARGLIEWTNDLNLKDLYLKRDRTLLVSDYRQKEAKKFGGRGARKRRQKSYR